MEHVSAPSENSIVILNAPLLDFYECRNERVTLNKNIRVVTHHWSDNIKKGFDIYSSFNDHVDVKKYLFTYIGRYSDKYSKWIFREV